MGLVDYQFFTCVLYTCDPLRIGVSHLGRRDICPSWFSSKEVKEVTAEVAEEMSKPETFNLKPEACTFKQDTEHNILTFT